MASSVGVVAQMIKTVDLVVLAVSCLIFVVPIAELEFVDGAVVGHVFSILLVLAIFFALAPRYFSHLITSNTDREAHIRDVFPGMVDKGILFMALGGLCVTGIVSGTKYLDEDQDTLGYIGWVLTIGFLSFYIAHVLLTGHRFHYLTFVGVSACLAFVGMISFHFSFPTLEPLAIVIAPIFTFILLVLHQIKHAMIKYGVVKNPNFGANPECPSHQECLESVLKIGLQLSVFGIGLLGVVTWANLVDKAPIIHALLAIYTGVSFWLFCGAKLLGNGVIFEVFVWAGAVLELCTFLTSTLHALLPVSGFYIPIIFVEVLVTVSGYEFALSILAVSVVLVSLSLEWCRIQTLLEYIGMDYS